MAETKIKSVPENVVERNIRLDGIVMDYLLAHPEVFNSLPEHFQLVILPTDDPEIRAYNLELLDRFSREDKPIVFVRISSQIENSLESLPLNLYVPLAA